MDELKGNDTGITGIPDDQKGEIGKEPTDKEIIDKNYLELWKTGNQV